MSQKLKIGITACFFYPDITRKTFGKKTLLYYEESMAHWVLNSGHFPILLPSSTQNVNSTEVVSFVDGVILHGGADVAPESYGEKSLSESWPGDAQRDKYEIAIYKECLKQNIPVLGTCRGAQVINVAHGGTLYQDIPSQKPNALKHRDAIIYDNLFHEVQWKKGGLLEEVYKDSPAKTINTVHHQAIKDLAEDLVVEATSPEDQIIEGIRLKESELQNPEKPFVLGVQWHPEFMTHPKDQHVSSDTLLKMFIEQVRIRKC